MPTRDVPACRPMLQELGNLPRKPVREMPRPSDYAIIFNTLRHVWFFPRFFCFQSRIWIRGAGRSARGRSTSTWRKVTPMMTMLMCIARMSNRVESGSGGNFVILFGHMLIVRAVQQGNLQINCLSIKFSKFQPLPESTPESTLLDMRSRYTLFGQSSAQHL